MSNTQAALRLIVLSAIFPLCIFPFAGRWSWTMAWVVVATMVIATLLSRLLAFRVHPDLLAERASSMSAADAKAWDRVLAPAMGVTPLLILIVAGLDQRFQWTSELSLSVHMVGLLLIVVGYGVSTWAMVANRFFSGVVRIQTERGHHVVDDGPYAIVRHPAYTGNFIACVGLPLALDSLWAFVPALLALIVTIVRTQLEDSTLQNELTGYAEFTKHTRFRLIPGIW